MEIEAICQSGARILCLGDVMIDRFVYGSVDRISPEAPIPIFKVSRERKMAGGAANVACNAAALGSPVVLCSALGNDPGGRDLQEILARERNIRFVGTIAAGRQTSTKTRFVADGQQLLRVDEETTGPLLPAERSALTEAVLRELRTASVLLISDYAKGIIDDQLLREVISSARGLGCPVLVDPKANDFSKYSGANLVTPNARELHLITGLPTRTDDEVGKAGKRALDRFGMDCLVVTRSADGITIIAPDQEAMHMRAIAREILDVSGAGDTVLAVLGVAIGAGALVEEAARMANVAGSIAVSKSGTAIVRAEELACEFRRLASTTPALKIFSQKALLDQVWSWRAAGQKIGFTNGCFDIIHPGHVSLLEAAKANCDRLVVALNSDMSVRRLKGPARPVNNECARSVVLGSLACVDAVVTFPEDTPMELIAAVQPEVLFKGADYTVDHIVGAEFVRSYGGEVVCVPLCSGFSTTEVISRLKELPI